MTEILVPVFVQVGLTFVLMGWMGFERIKAVRAGTVQRGSNAGIRPVWPERAGVVSNAFQNQFEMPMLFYAVVALALIVNRADTAMVTLAWTFVALRIVHALIYTTYNNVPHRFLAYLASSMVLLAMWGKLAASAGVSV